jgi:hypothetical protein
VATATAGLGQEQPYVLVARTFIWLIGRRRALPRPPGLKEGREKHDDILKNAGLGGARTRRTTRLIKQERYVDHNRPC